MIHGLIRLTRYQDYLNFVTATTLLGILFTRVDVSWDVSIRMLIILLANMLTVGFSFMINDIEDAPDDAINPQKAKRNPISSGHLSAQTGYIASLAVALSAAGLYALLGFLPFLLGVTCLIICHLYSWRLVRLKTIPGLDLISHGLMLAGLQVLCAFFTFSPYKGLDAAWIAPTILTMVISIRGELFNEVRDLTYDTKAGVTHTVTLIGVPLAQLLMYLLLGIAAVIALYCIVIGLIPIWFAAIFLIVNSLLFFQRDRTVDLQHAVLNISVCLLLIWLAVRGILSP